MRVQTSFLVILLLVLSLGCAGGSRGTGIRPIRVQGRVISAPLPSTVPATIQTFFEEKDTEVSIEGSFSEELSWLPGTDVTITFPGNQRFVLEGIPEETTVADTLWDLDGLKLELLSVEYQP